MYGVCSETYLGFEVTGVASGFCSGGERIVIGCDFTARPADDDAGVLNDAAGVGVLLAIAAHVGLAGLTANVTSINHCSTLDFQCYAFLDKKLS